MERGCAMNSSASEDLAAKFYRDTCIFSPSSHDTEEPQAEDQVVQTPGTEAAVNKLGIYLGVPASIIGILLGVAAVAKCYLRKVIFQASFRYTN
jgi:hypothetical protein